jgi:hypothetical protein
MNLHVYSYVQYIYGIGITCGSRVWESALWISVLDMVLCILLQYTMDSNVILRKGMYTGYTCRACLYLLW